METSRIYRHIDYNMYYPVGFYLFLRQSPVATLGGLSNIHIPSIEWTMHRAINVLERAPISLPMEDRRDLLVGYMRRKHQAGWDDLGFTTSALVSEYEAINRLRPWYYQLEYHMRCLQISKGNSSSWHNINWEQVVTPPRAKRKPPIFTQRRMLTPAVMKIAV